MALRRRDDRVILHFDYDCFYAQVVENRPGTGERLTGRCVGVTQKSILATCNYAARRRGVCKLMRITEARRVCPDLVLVDGEDLSPFRDASKRLFRLVRALVAGCPVERLGLDEVFVDATALVAANLARLRAAGWAWGDDAVFCLRNDDTDDDGNCFPLNTRAFVGHVVGQTDDTLQLSAAPSDAHLRLLLGSHLAAYLRGRLVADAHYTASGGIATSKLLAKLAGKQHKPAAQTVLLSGADDDAAVRGFMDVLPLPSVTGIGFKTSWLVGAFIKRQSTDANDDNPVTVAQARHHPGMSPRLLDTILAADPGAASNGPPGALVWALLHGIDDTPVRPTADAPAQISIEDTYAGPRRHLLLPGVGGIAGAAPTPAVVAALHQLATSLLRRMHADLLGASGPDRWLARPRTLRLTLRAQPTDPDYVPPPPAYYAYARSSHSQPLPAFVLGLATPPAQIVDRLVTTCLVPMFRRLSAAVVPLDGSVGPRRPDAAAVPWTVGLLNVCVANMAVAGEGGDIAALFRRQHDQDQKDGNVEADADEADDDEDADDTDAAWLAADTTAAVEACVQCGRLLPSFAQAAHARFHLLGDA